MPIQSNKQLWADFFRSREYKKLPVKEAIKLQVVCDYYDTDDKESLAVRWGYKNLQALRVRLTYLRNRFIKNAQNKADN